MPSSPPITTVADDLLTVVVVPGDAPHVTVRLEGEIDLGNTDHLAEVLTDQLRSGRRVVTVDLSHVTFVNSAGLRVLALAHNQYLHAGGSLVLTGVSARTARLLAITHLDTALSITDTSSVSTPPRHLVSVASTTSPRR